MENLLLCSRQDLRTEIKTILNEIRKEQEQLLRDEKSAAQLLTPDEVMSQLAISDTTLWRWGKAGYLSPIYIGGQRRYKQIDVDSIIRKEDSNEKY